MGRRFLAVMGSGGRIRITTCPELAEERVSPQGKKRHVVVVGRRSSSGTLR